MEPSFSYVGHMLLLNMALFSMNINSKRMKKTTLVVHNNNPNNKDGCQYLQICSQVIKINAAKIYIYALEDIKQQKEQDLLHTSNRQDKNMLNEFCIKGTWEENTRGCSQFPQWDGLF